MKTYPFVFIFLCFLVSCDKTVTKKSSSDLSEIPVAYAQGFTLQQADGYVELTIKTPYPNSTESFKYALVPKENKLPSDINKDDYTAVLATPIERIVVTSTTHIPSLDMLGVLETLVGFPNTEYISSPTAREAIKSGTIEELGTNEAINTERTIALQPEVIIAFGVDSKSKALNTVSNAGIPVIYNGDWIEQHPLGKAEWLKLFGVLYRKEGQANAIFNDIENEYNTAKKLAQKAPTKPTVLSGAMYKDVWYLPYGNSWAGQLIKDANATYLWADTQGSGSIALSIESVLDKAQQADVWIAPGQYATYSDLLAASTVYKEFKPFKEKAIYNFAEAKGETGGMLYYELAPNRPDLVLKDLIHHLHPTLLEGYSPTFFTNLRE